MRAMFKVSTTSRRSFIKAVVAAPALSSVFSRTSWAAGATYDYYISPTGSLSNSGSIDSPWSIDALTVKTQIAGRRVGLLDGQYTVSSTYADNWGGNPNRHGLRISQAGSAASPTVVEAVNYGGAILAPAADVDFSVLTIEAPYVQVKGLVFDAKTVCAIRMWGDYGTIEACDFLPIHANANGDNFGAIYFKAKGATPVKRPVIRNCAFRGVYNSVSTYTSNGAAIMGFSISDALIEFCTVSNTYSLFKPKYDWFGYTVRYNYAYNVMNFIQQLSVPAGFSGRVQVHNNLALAASGDYMYHPTEKAADADVFNNTIVIAGSSGSAIRWWKNIGETRNTGKFYNNIVAVRSTPSSGLRIHTFGGMTGTGYQSLFDQMDYNAYPAGYFSACDGDYYEPTASWGTMSAWRAASGFDSNSLQTNPGFVNIAGQKPEDFKLLDTSPCRNAGRLGGVSTGGTVDQGCWTSGVGVIGANLGRSAFMSSVAPTLRVE